MGSKTKDKPLVYVIDKESEIRGRRAIKRDMKKNEIIVLLGMDLTPQMEKEVAIVDDLRRVILRRPYIKTLEHLMEVGIFPNHIKRGGKK